MSVPRAPQSGDARRRPISRGPSAFYEALGWQRSDASAGQRSRSSRSARDRRSASTASRRLWRTTPRQSHPPVARQSRVPRRHAGHQRRLSAAAVDRMFAEFVGRRAPRAVKPPDARSTWGGYSGLRRPTSTGICGSWPTTRTRPSGRHPAPNEPSPSPVTSLPMARSYVVRTFGCQMNEHDSERIAGLLEADGLVPVDVRGRRRRRGAQHLLHPGERRQQALRQPRPAEAVEGRSATAARSWWPAAWPRRTATWCAQKAPWVDVVLGTHNVHRAAELVAARPRARPDHRDLRRGRASTTTRCSPARCRRGARRRTTPGSPSRSAATTTARSASCRRCAASRSAARSTTIVAEVRDARPPRASPRSRCSART